jgi:NADH-quinone oxidoreductase subunit N
MLVAVLVINSVIGLYYYLRIIAVMFVPLAGAETASARPALAGSLVLGVLVILLIWWGVYPAPLVSLIQNIAFR